MLKLHSLVNYSDIAELTTTNDGTFDCETIAAGLYFLQIIPTREKTADLYKSEGNVAIYITPQESYSSLSISVADTDCGLSYDLEENKARYKPESCFKGGKPVKCDY